MTTNTYLSFPGTCEEAFQFYASALGGKILMSMKGQDMPGENNCPSDFKDKIMHTRMTVGSGVIMGSDCPPDHFEVPRGFHVNIGVEDPKEADRIYAALATGGKETIPIAETFWAHRFGMCVDRFGTPWMVNCEKKMG
jgi:PhnB protein